LGELDPHAAGHEEIGPDKADCQGRETRYDPSNPAPTYSISQHGERSPVEARGDVERGHEKVNYSGARNELFGIGSRE
jgi:hypothetical protein